MSDKTIILSRMDTLGAPIDLFLNNPRMPSPHARPVQHLTRSLPERNMHRFYAVHVVPSLFGDWLLVAEWGRIGCSGTVRAHSFANQDDADRAMAAVVKNKVRRGYVADGRQANLPL